MGGSNDTVDAPWMTISMSSGSFEIDVSEPSTTEMRFATIASTFSSPTDSRQALKTGLRMRFARRDSPVDEPLPRTRIDTWVSG